MDNHQQKSSDCYNTSPHSVIASQLLYVYKIYLSFMELVLLIELRIHNYNKRYAICSKFVIEIWLNLQGTPQRITAYVMQPSFKYVYQLVIAFDLVNRQLSPVALGYISRYIQLYIAHCVANQLCIYIYSEMTLTTQLITFVEYIKSVCSQT